MRQLRELATRVDATVPRVLGRTDEEAIHDMRVAIRRLRVLLKNARPIFGRFHVDAVRDVLTRVHRASGALRDEEVLRETLTSLPVRRAAFSAWVQRRAHREEQLRLVIVLRLRRGELRRPLHALRALIVLPVRPSRRMPLSQFAREAVTRAERDVERQRDVATDDAKGLHALRIAYKRLRYATELLSEGLPADMLALAKPAAQFQKLLGEIHDLDVARATVIRARSLDRASRNRAVACIARQRARAVASYVLVAKP